jgi:hypothetical protein
MVRSRRDSRDHAFNRSRCLIDRTMELSALSKFMAVRLLIARMEQSPLKSGLSGACRCVETT